MALSLAGFRARSGTTFATATDEQIEAVLAAALIQTPSDIWGDTADEGQFQLAAHLLAIDPAGRMAKLVSKDGSTTYGKRRQEMARALALGCRVT